MSIPAMDKIKFGPEGLIPAVVQAPGGEVRMVGYMNADGPGPHPGDRLGHLLEPQPRKALGQGRDQRQPAEVRRTSSWTATATPCWCWPSPEGPTCHRGHTVVLRRPGPGGLAGPPGGDPARAQGAAPAPTAATPRSCSTGAPSASARRWWRRRAKWPSPPWPCATNRPPQRREDFVNEAADLLFHLQVLLTDQGLGLKDLAEALKARHK